MVEHEIGDKPDEDLTAALEQTRGYFHLKLVPDLTEVEAEPVVGSHYDFIECSLLFFHLTG